VNIRNCVLLTLNTTQLIKDHGCRKITKLVLNVTDVPVLDSDIHDLCLQCPDIEELTVDGLVGLTLNCFAYDILRRLNKLRMLSCAGLPNSDLIVDIWSYTLTNFLEVDYCAMKVVGTRRLVSIDDLPNLRKRIQHRFSQVDAEANTFAEWRLKSNDVGFFGHPMKLLWLSFYMKTITIGMWLQDAAIARATTCNPELESVANRMELIADDFKHLTELNIVESNVDDSHVLIFAEAAKHALAVLRLSDCPGVGDIGVQAMMAAHNSTLRVVHIHRCHPDLSDAALKSVEQCAGLREISVSGQPAVTAEGMDGVKRSCEVLSRCSFNAFHV
jgi:hypothetical protein